MIDMTYRIVQYIQPWEIDDFERQIHNLLPSTYILPPNTRLIWDVTMNVDIVCWDESRIPKEYYLERFEYLKKIVNYNCLAEFDTNPEIKGCSDKRRDCSKKKHDFVIWLDSDVFSTANTLPYLVMASKQIESESYILTPEIVKFWDSSWDQITNKHFLNQPYDFRDTFNVYSIDALNTSEPIVKNNTRGVKFAGGWFNLFTDSVLKRLLIPDEIGAYGPDDTYIMACAHHIGIPQYLLEGVLVTDAGCQYTRNEYKKNHLTSLTGSHSRISDKELITLIQRFYNEN